MRLIANSRRDADAHALPLRALGYSQSIAEGEVSQRSLAYVGQSLMPVLCPSRPTVPQLEANGPELG
jgi:hypothetical protein